MTVWYVITPHEGAEVISVQHVLVDPLAEGAQWPIHFVRLV